MMGILFAAQGASQVGNALDGLAEARVVAYQVWQVLNRKEGSPEQTLYYDDDDNERDDDVSTALTITPSRHLVVKKQTNKDNINKSENGSESLSRLEKGMIYENVSNEDDEGDGASSSLTNALATSAIRAVLPAYKINPFSKEGLKPEQLEGRIEFENVSFSYPTRPSECVLDNFSLKIPAGKTVALVGPSGGGRFLHQGCGSKHPIDSIAFLSVLTFLSCRVVFQWLCIPFFSFYFIRKINGGIALGKVL